MTSVESEGRVTLSELESKLWSRQHPAGAIDQATLRATSFRSCSSSASATSTTRSSSRHSRVRRRRRLALRENHRFQVAEGAHWKTSGNGRERRTSHPERDARIEQATRTSLGIFGEPSGRTRSAADSVLRDLVDHYSSFLSNSRVESDVLAMPTSTHQEIRDLSNKKAASSTRPVRRKDARHILDHRKARPSTTRVRHRACSSRCPHVKESGVGFSCWGRFRSGKNSRRQASPDEPLLHVSKTFDVIRATRCATRHSLSRRARTFDWSSLTLRSPWRVGRRDLGERPLRPQLRGHAAAQRDYAWVEHMVKSWPKTGRLAVVLPRARCFGVALSSIRKHYWKPTSSSIIGLAPILLRDRLAACVMVLRHARRLSVPQGAGGRRVQLFKRGPTRTRSKTSIASA